MRNTITLNGVESSTIPGLLIQSLAPISKPLMRTEVETIDGRDGDITTDLGFSAYDKQISIGLFADYDIDQIIAYFNSKGTVIFSNEPDKFYNYEIVDQIDFERLVRYRTATVTMHCQPFKYSTTEAADILSTNSNFATLDQSINSDASNFSYSSNVQADVTATRTTTTGGGKFFATFTMNVVQGVTYYFSGNAANNCTMYGYKDRIWGTSAGFSGRKLPQFPSYTATYTGTLIIGFYSVTTEPVFIRNFKISNQSVGTVSGEGTNIVLENSAEAQFSRFDLKGNTEQDTYSGKNLVFTNANTAQGITATYDAVTGTTTVSGTATLTYAVFGTNLSNLPAGTYTFSIQTAASIGIGIGIRIDGGSRQAKPIPVGNTEVTFTTSGTITSYDIYLTGLTAGDSYNLSFKAQLEAGSSATSFEPYVGGVPSPNPGYPQAVKVVTGENTVKIKNRNLAYAVTSTSQGITFGYNGESGEVSFSGTASGTWASNSRNYNVLSAGTYTISIDKPLTVAIGIGTWAYNGVRTAWAIPAGSTSRTFTLDGEASGFDVYLTSLTTGTYYNETVKLQFEKSSQATAFEPHQEQSYPISLGSLELCKIGNYQDYFYKNGDKWYKHKAVDKVVLGGTESYNDRSNTSTTHYKAYTSGNVLSDNIAGTTTLICDHFIANTGANNASYSGNAMCGSTTSGYEKRLWISIDNTIASSTSTLKAWLVENKPTVYYALATPVDEEITSEALKEQLDYISQANAHRKRTYINASAAATGNVPHIIAAEVAADPSGTITNSGNIYSKPKLTIFGSGNVGVYLNGVQMFQIALGTNDYITIDTAIMEAYQDNLQTLKNRSVTGDYNNFKLPVGESEISFSGNVTMCVVENYSRWL